MMSKTSAIITLLTDFGYQDGYVAAMKGVILKVSPKTKIVDISHDLLPFSISSASYVLKSCYQEFPRGTIHLAVVDPGVGTDRKALLIQTKDFYFVGPDNGLFSFLDNQEILKVMDIGNSPLLQKTPTPTFHGRDIFAPVAARLAEKGDIQGLGSVLAKESLVRLKTNEPVQEAGNPKRWRGNTIHVDRFGNLITNIEAATLGRAQWTVIVANKEIGPIEKTFANVPLGEPVALIGSSGHLEIAVHGGSAYDLFAPGPLDRIYVEKAVN